MRFGLPGRPCEGLLSFHRASLAEASIRVEWKTAQTRRSVQ